jgi:hypothetical protein
MAMNVIAVLGAATLVRTGFFAGRRMLLLLVAVPLAQVAGDWFGTPHFVALNSDASHWVKASATLLPIGICALVVDALARVLAPEVNPDDARPGSSVHRGRPAAVGPAAPGAGVLAG